MINPLAFLEKHADEIRSFHVRRISVFGSFAPGEATEESNLDIFVKLAPEVFGFDNFMEFSDRLGALFGRPVDVIPKGGLKLRMASIIEPTVVYAAA